MSFERVALFGVIDVDLECTGQGILRLSTDLPGNRMALREERLIAACTRRVVRFRLRGTTKGRLYILTIFPSQGVMRLYGAKILARVLPLPSWDWYTVPIPATSSEWVAVPLPIPPTSESWEPVKLPIPETGNWEQKALPVPPCGDWTPVKLPIKETPANPEWVNLDVDE